MNFILIKHIMIFIFIIFILIFGIFLYFGSNIYELLIYSGFNNIYDKINNNAINIIENENNDINFVYALSNDYIYITDGILKFNSLNNEIYITDNKNKNIFNIFKDEAIIKTLFLKLNKKFNYNKLN